MLVHQVPMDGDWIYTTVSRERSLVGMLWNYAAVRTCVIRFISTHAATSKCSVV